MKLGKIGLGVVLTATLLAATQGTSSARELRGGSGANPPVAAALLFNQFSDKVGELSGGNLTIRNLGPEVAPLKSAISNLQGGVLDVGNILTLYFPAEFPHFMLVGELATLGENGQAMTGAVTEYIFTCKPCLDEFTSKELVFLGSGASSSYQLNTRTPVKTLADLKGMKLRSAGAPFTRWAESMDAVPVELSFNEEYEAVASGLVDGTMNPPGAMLNGKMYELLQHVTMMNIGTFHTASQFTVSKKTWDSLSAEEKGWFAQAAMEASANSLPLFKKTDQDVLALVDVIEPGDELVAAREKAQQDAIAAAVQAGVSRYGIADAQAEVDRFAELVKKWNAIVAEIGEDNTEAMAERLNSEVFSKVDLATYPN